MSYMAYKYSIKTPINGFNIYQVKAISETEALEKHSAGESEFIDTEVTNEGDPAASPIEPCLCDICEEDQKQAA